MAEIQVKDLKKTFRVQQKDPGFIGSVKSLFNRQYQDINAVAGVSFEINQSELVGFIGPNGAGKTTTLKMLAGLLYPTSGEVSVLGFTPWDRKPEFQKQFSLVMGQKNQLWWDLPAMESFILNKEIYEIPDAKFKSNLDQLVDLLDVRPLLKTQVRKLSLGQRMKMELIAALLHTPRILFLDEPTIGLDVVMQKKMRDFIKEYNRSFHSTIILTSHYMEDVKDLCRRVIIIDNGKILFDGLLSDIVNKFSKHKTITVVFDRPVEKRELLKLAEIREFNFPRAVLTVDRVSVSAVAGKLLQDFPVADLNIEEPVIEDIIREVFTNHRPS
jgi:ABC-2 type transport system ATP-binding protein